MDGRAAKGIKRRGKVWHDGARKGKERGEKKQGKAGQAKCSKWGRGATYLLQASVHFWMLLIQVPGIVLYFVGLT